MAISSYGCTYADEREGPAVAKEEDLATTEEVAEFLKIDPKTVANWRTQRIGPDYIRVARNCVRYSWAAVQKWQAARTVELASRGIGAAS
jgi:hypothetical protein